MFGSGGGFACDQQGPERLVSSSGRIAFGDPELHGCQIRRLLVLPSGSIYRDGFGGLDLQDYQTNSIGEKDKMTTLASMSDFFGTVWFVVILCAASFGAGVVFQTQFLKLVTGGKYQG